jgi:hypothetical protein
VGKQINAKLCEDFHRHFIQSDDKTQRETMKVSDGHFRRCEWKWNVSYKEEEEDEDEEE